MNMSMFFQTQSAGNKGLYNAKKIVSSLLIVVLSSNFHSLKSEHVQVLTRVGGGFFSDFFSVLHHLTWCDKHKLTPYVYWGNKSLYYDKALGENVWEYYFEQLSDFNYPSNSTQVDIRNSFKSVDGFEIHYARGYENIVRTSFRQNLNTIIKKYIKVKPHILALVDQYYKANFEGKTTIGIHIRGTDKGRESKPVSIERICAQANECSLGMQNVQFFVASDEESLLNRAKQLLSGPVIACNSTRSLNGKSIHRAKQEQGKYKLGEEVLVETLLLARCSKLVHTRSNVSSAVLFFNPELKNFLLM